MTDLNREILTDNKPDDRSDNVDKLQEMVTNTIENIEEAHDALATASDEEKEQIEQKNERRNAALKGLRKEIKDEYAYQQRKE